MDRAQEVIDYVTKTNSLAVYDRAAVLAHGALHAALKPPLTLLGGLYHTAVVLPLRRLYQAGPALRGWGFWGGAPVEDICASLSGAPGTFWAQHADECVVLIERNFAAVLVAAESLAYAYLVACLLVYAVGALMRPCSRRHGRPRPARRDH